MIVSVEEFRSFVSTDENDQQIEFRILSAESFIKRFTNNEFLNGYPDDVKFGVINMIRWDMENRERAGIASETLSRHSVTYESGADTISGYPVSVIGFLKLYEKARF